MKHRVLFFALVPVLSFLGSQADAAFFRCGGCSDPCRSSAPVRSCAHGYGESVMVSDGYNAPMAFGGCGSTILEASPISTGYVAADGGYAGQSLSVNHEALCEPVTGYRVVMEPQFVTETVAQAGTETVTETRYRTKTVYKTVPITENSYVVKTVMVPKTETKTVEYSVLVPVESTKTVEVSVSVPVWNDISENYTVKVPQIIDVPESYQVKVPALRDESFTYTVYVPQTETVTKMQTVTNAVPVTKTKTVTRVVPVYSTKTLTRDAGHYETVVDEVASAATYSSEASVSNGCNSVVTYRGHGNGCGDCAPVVSSGCGCSPAVSFGGGSSSVGCGISLSYSDSTANSGCGNVSVPSTRMISKQVWVPNVVSEEVPVVSSKSTNEEIAYTVFEQQSEQIPYECTYIVNKPEVRTGTRQVVDYKMETRERTRKQVKYIDETRTRTRKELTYKTEMKSESYPVVSYSTEKKTKDITFTFNVPETVNTPVQSIRYDQVAEEVVEEYTVAIQVPTMKEVTVQVCKMVPKMVPYNYSPCANGSSSEGFSSSSTSSGSMMSGCGDDSRGCGAVDPVTSGCGCGS